MHEVTDEDPPTCRRCGGCRFAAQRASFSAAICPVKVLVYGQSPTPFDWGRWVYEWIDCRPGGRKHKQKAEYNDAAKLVPRGNEAEACRRLFAGRAWVPHDSFRVRGQSACVLSGSTGADAKSINARPCPGDAPFVTVSAWALLREASADACESTSDRAVAARRKLAARKTC